MAILLTALLYTLAGWPVTYMLGPISKIERLGLSFLMGIGLTTFAWFLLYLFVGQFDLLTLTVSGFFLASISLIINRILGFRLQKLVIPKLGRIERWLAGILIFLLVQTFLIGSYNPISGWDAIALYDFRGRTIALNHSLQDLTDDSYYTSYPLMTSLAHAAVYMLGGESAQGLHSLLLIAFIAVVYGRLQSWTNARFALLGALFIVLNEEIFQHATVAYVNLAYVVFLVSSILYAVSPTKKGGAGGYLFVGAILAGLTTWIRSDVPFWLIPLALIMIQGLKTRAIVIATCSSLTAYLMRHTWLNFYNEILNSLKLTNERLANPITVNALKQFSQYIPDSSTISLIEGNAPVLVEYLYQYLFAPYRGFWLLVLLMLLVLGKTKNFRLGLIVLALLMSAGMAVMGVMLFSVSYSTWDLLGGSARRMMLFIVPLSLLASVYSAFLARSNKITKHE